MLRRMTKKTILESTRRGNGSSRPSRSKATARGSKFTMLLSRDERSQLYELASNDGVPASVYLRTLIRTMHHKSATDQSATKKRSKKPSAPEVER